MADLLNTVVAQLNTYALPPIDYVARTRCTTKKGTWVIAHFSKCPSMFLGDAFTTGDEPLSKKSMFQMKPPTNPVVVSTSKAIRWRFLFRPSTMEGESLASPTDVTIAGTINRPNTADPEGEAKEGDANQDDLEAENLSLMLCLEYMGLPRRTRVEVDLRVWLVTNKNKEFNPRSAKHVFTNEGAFGFPDFISHSIVMENPRGICDDNNLRINWSIEVREETSVVSSVPKPISTLYSDEGETSFLHLLDFLGPWSDIIVCSTPRAHDLHCHCVFLCAASPALAEMILSLEAELGGESGRKITGRPLELRLDHPPLAVRGAMQYIYTGKVSSMEEIAGDLLKVANSLQLTQLKYACQERLVKSIGANNVAKMLSLAVDHDANLLHEALLGYAKSNEKMLKAVNNWRDALDFYPAFKVLISPESKEEITNPESNQTISTGDTINTSGSTMSTE